MRILILGGGFGGVNTALKLGKKLKDSNHEIILVAEKPHFLFRPSLPWVVFNERKLDDVTRPLDKILQKVGVEFIQKTIIQVLPKNNKVILQDDTVLDYDYLVIATGGLPDFEKIPGLKENTYSCYFEDDTQKTKERIENIKSGDQILIGASNGNPCTCLSIEFLFELDAYLQKQNINASITYFTYEKDLFDYVGNKVSSTLEKLLNEKEIPFYKNVSIEKVEPNLLHLTNGESFPFTFSLITPAFKGRDYIFASPDLDHVNGLIPVHNTLQSRQWRNVYSVGDTIYTPIIIHKSGLAAEIQGHIAAENIYSSLLGKSPEKKFVDTALGMMELGTKGGMAFIKYPNKRNEAPLIEMATQGVLPHLMKAAFEKYYLWKLS
jgi:sulfide:quinone oxidoreductase